MRVLALDLGRQLGYAVGVGERVTRYGTVDLSAGPRSQALAGLYAFMRMMLTYPPGIVAAEVVGKIDARPGGVTYVKPGEPIATLPLRYDAVIYERPFCRGAAATRSLWGMAGVVEAAAENAGAAVLDQTVGAIKKWASGDGAASKGTMIEAARRNGYDPKTDHEADAIMLALHALATMETN